MTIEEAIQRILRAHLVLILICLAAPLAVTAYVVSREPTSYQASVRIQVSSTPATTTVAASAISSRVLALATTPSLLSQAMTKAGDPRAVPDVARHHVTASRLGESSIVELSVTDVHARQASATAAALATGVTQFMNKANRADLADALAGIADDISAAQRARSTVARPARDHAPGQHRPAGAVGQAERDRPAARRALPAAHLLAAGEPEQRRRRGGRCQRAPGAADVGGSRPTARRRRDLRARCSVWRSPSCSRPSAPGWLAPARSQGDSRSRCWDTAPTTPRSCPGRWASQLVATARTPWSSSA